MKKFILTALLCLLSMSVGAKKRYAELYFGWTSVVMIDGSKDGEVLKDESGKPLKFQNQMSAVNYMSLKGWELFQIVPRVSGEGKTDTSQIYVFCKEVSDEELAETVKKGVKQ